MQYKTLCPFLEIDAVFNILIITNLIIKKKKRMYLTTQIFKNSFHHVKIIFINDFLPFSLMKIIEFFPFFIFY